MMATLAVQSLDQSGPVIAMNDGTHTVEMNARQRTSRCREALRTLEADSVESFEGTCMLLALLILQASATLRQPCGTPSRLSITVATPLDIISPPTTELVDQESHRRHRQRRLL